MPAKGLTGNHLLKRVIVSLLVKFSLTSIVALLPPCSGLAVQVSTNDTTTPSPPLEISTVNDLQSWLEAVTRVNPTQTRLLELTRTAYGLPILAFEIRSQHLPLKQFRRCAIICRQHGDEPEATSAGAELIYRLLAVNTLRTWQIRGCTAVVVIPMANPEGAERMTRENDLGQDLNRDWGVGRTREVSAIKSFLSSWSPHLVIDVHQWVPGDSCQRPLLEVSGGRLARRASTLIRQSCSAHGFKLSLTSWRGSGGGLCNRYFGRAAKIPAILFETRHVPSSPKAFEKATRSSVIGLLRAIDLLAEQEEWPDDSILPFCGVETRHSFPRWYQNFTRRMRSLDRKALEQLLQTAEESHEATFESYLARGRVSLEVLNYSAAKYYFQKAVELRPQDSDAAFLTAATTFLGESISASLPVLEKSLQLNPHHQGIRLYRARAYEIEGRQREAIKLYQSVATGTSHTLLPYRRYAKARIRKMGL